MVQMWKSVGHGCSLNGTCLLVEAKSKCSINGVYITELYSSRGPMFLPSLFY